MTLPGLGLIPLLFQKCCVLRLEHKLGRWRKLLDLLSFFVFGLMLGHEGQDCLLLLLRQIYRQHIVPILQGKISLLVNQQLAYLELIAQDSMVQRRIVAYVDHVLVNLAFAVQEQYLDNLEGVTLHLKVAAHHERRHPSLQILIVGVCTELQQYVHDLDARLRPLAAALNGPEQRGEDHVLTGKCLVHVGLPLRIWIVDTGQEFLHLRRVVGLNGIQKKLVARFLGLPPVAPGLDRCDFEIFVELAQVDLPGFYVRQVLELTVFVIVFL